jgi:uracil-DNA glycosylase family 4
MTYPHNDNPDVRILQLYEDILLGQYNKLPIATRPGQIDLISCLPGHKMGNPGEKGVQQADVMVIHKRPRHSDMFTLQYVTGFTPQYCNPNTKAGQYFRSVTKKFGLDISDWYITAVFKCLHPEDPERGSRLLAGWVNEFYPILLQEIYLVKPKIILLQGTDAVKALLGSQSKLGDYLNRVSPYTILDHTCQVVVTPDPMSVIVSDDGDADASYQAAFSTFVDLVKGNKREKEKVKHYIIRDFKSWKVLLKKIHEEIEDNLLAVDAEWNGSHPQNSNAWLRTIQLSWKDKTAAAVIIRNTAGICPYTREELDEIKKDFYGLICKYVIAGHYVDSDFEYLIYEGFIPSIASLPKIPATPSLYREAVLNGTNTLFDTAIAAHAVSETSDFSLTAQFSQHCPGAPRYDMVLEDYIKKFCKERKIKREDLQGYGELEDKYLCPYGCYDADVTRRLAVHYKQALSSDEYGLDCWRPFHISMRQFHPFLEMNSVGILIDVQRVKDLTALYSEKSKILYDKIVAQVNWTGLNLNSHYQTKELLFGEHLNTKIGPDGRNIRLRPAGALTLNLTPVRTTSHGITWEQAVRSEKTAVYAPSTDKESLALLYRDEKDGPVRNILKDIIHYKTIAHTLRYVLKPPVTKAMTLKDELDETGDDVYEAGLMSFLCDDTKIRTHFYMTKETGRASSSRPSMQNLSKNREALYAEVLGDEYFSPLRSIVTVPPGHFLISSDFSGAELAALAIGSNDTTLLDHTERNKLPEDHPNFYDIHSNICVSAFKLNCPPTKTGLKSLNKAHLRGASKTIIFGLMYGRGIYSIWGEIKQAGVNMPLQEVEQLVEHVKSLYPNAIRFLDACANRVTTHGYMYGMLGRIRRVPSFATLDQSDIAEYGRQFKNFYEQNGVADVCAQSLYNLFWERYNRKVEYDIVLQIHDEIILVVPAKYMEIVYDEILPKCMGGIDIHPIGLDGNLLGTGPFRLGIDPVVHRPWTNVIKEEIWRAEAKAANNSLL